MADDRIYLSPPDLGSEERRALLAAFDSNWVATSGPEISAFEAEVARRLDAGHAVAVSSGTAGLHLSLVAHGIGPGDRVLVPTFTFAATVNAVTYVGATPILIDSDPGTWTIDAQLVAAEIERRARTSQPVRAVIPVDIYGQTCDYDAIRSVCDDEGVLVIEDAAEALGSDYRGNAAGALGQVGVISFNGNKILTAGGGGMVLTDESAVADRVRRLAAQAREPVLHYEHREIGYNYRMNNLLAAIGRVQLARLPQLVKARREVFTRYTHALSGLPGVRFMPEAYGTSNRWLTVLQIAPDEFGATPEEICRHLDDRGVEARPAWKPMHRQPVYSSVDFVGGSVADRLYEGGLCLPSGSALTPDEQDRVIDGLRDAHARGRA